MKKQIIFKDKSYDFDKFENEIEVFELDDEELEEYLDLLPKYSADFSKPLVTWTGDEYIKGCKRFLDDDRYEDDEISEMKDFYKTNFN